jgi:hypothetical protein
VNPFDLTPDFPNLERRIAEKSGMDGNYVGLFHGPFRKLAGKGEFESPLIGEDIAPPYGQYKGMEVTKGAIPPRPIHVMGMENIRLHVPDQSPYAEKMAHEANQKRKPFLLSEGLQVDLLDTFRVLPLPYADEGDRVPPLGEIFRPSLHVNALAIADKADFQSLP